MKTAALIAASLSLAACGPETGLWGDWHYDFQVKTSSGDRAGRFGLTLAPGVAKNSVQITIGACRFGALRDAYDRVTAAYDQRCEPKIGESFPIAELGGGSAGGKQIRLTKGQLDLNPYGELLTHLAGTQSVPGEAAPKEPTFSFTGTGKALRAR